MHTQCAAGPPPSMPGPLLRGEGPQGAITRRRPPATTPGPLSVGGAAGPTMHPAQAARREGRRRGPLKSPVTAEAAPGERGRRRGRGDHARTCGRPALPARCPAPCPHFPVTAAPRPRGARSSQSPRGVASRG